MRWIYNNFILFGFCVALACVVGCDVSRYNPYFSCVNPKLSPARYEIDLAQMGNYKKLGRNRKIKLIRETRVYGDDNFQCMRFLCWLLEDDLDVRREIIRQWLAINKSCGSMGAANVILPRIQLLIRGLSTEQQQRRVSEFLEVYQLVERRNYCFNRGAELSNRLILGKEAGILTPLICPSEPMRLKLFASNLNCVSEAIESCARKNTIIIKNADGVEMGGSIRSTTIYDAMFIISRGLKSSVNDSDGS